MEQARHQAEEDVERRFAQLESDRQAWQQTQQEHESRMQHECAALESAREELRQQRGQHEAARAELDQRTAELAAELAARQTEYDARHAEHPRREQELNERAAGLDQRTAELGETQARLDEHRAELQEVQSGLEEARGELARAREALERTRAEIDQTRDELRTNERNSARRARNSTRSRSSCNMPAPRSPIRRPRLPVDSSSCCKATKRWKPSGSNLAKSNAVRWKNRCAEREELGRQREQDEAQLAERAEALERLAAEIENQRRQIHEDKAAESSAAAANDEQLARVAELEQSLAAARQQLAEQQQQLEESLRRCDLQATGLEQLHGELEQQRAAFDEERARWDEMRQELFSSDAAEIVEIAPAEVEPPADDLDEQSAGDLDEQSAGDFEEPQRWEADAEPSGVGVEDTVKMERDEPYEEDAYDGTEEVAEDVDALDVDPNMETQEFDVLRRSGSYEDKSIEECFAELLSRYRGQGVNVPEEPRQSAPRARRKSQASAGSDGSKAATDPDATKPINVVDVATEAIEMQRRSSGVVPNYGAMREVARSHAKLAIDTHGQKRLVRAALFTSTAALATLLATIVVVAVLPGQHAALRSLANVGWVGAIFWVFVAGKAWQQVEAAKYADRTGLRQNIEQASRDNPK